MGSESHTKASFFNLREIWVRRDDGRLEYKPWIIFDIILPESAKLKIRDFINKEAERTKNIKHENIDQKSMMNISYDYWNLNSMSSLMPPRLLSIKSSALEKLPTELVIQKYYILGDSVGGIGNNKPKIHNEALSNVVLSEKKTILFSPGVLCRIPIEINGETHFVFQLAEKNLRTKGQVFYKPIGGHLKYKIAFKKYIDVLNLKRKSQEMPQDTQDMAFFVEPCNFDKLKRIFQNEIASRKSEFFVNPLSTLAVELFEELGPEHASDGISLLSAEELKINVD